MKKRKKSSSPTELNLHLPPFGHNKSLRIIIGQNSYKNNKNDYCGDVGFIYYCADCCKDWRVQFFSMGNNELLRRFNLDNCRYFMARK